MLSENYKNALRGFKTQSEGERARFFEGCEAESQHIYRIIMTEQVSVVEINEVMLEKFLTHEMEGKSNYSKMVDRDGLQFVDLEKDVEVYPCVGDSYIEPINGEICCLSSFEAKSIINQLIHMNKLSLITETLQSLAQRQDGTKLQTALPKLRDLKECVLQGLVLPEKLVEKIGLWESLNCSVINFDFEELKYTEPRY